MCAHTPTYTYIYIYTHTHTHTHMQTHHNGTYPKLLTNLLKPQLVYKHILRVELIGSVFYHQHQLFYQLASYPLVFAVILLECKPIGGMSNNNNNDNNDQVTSLIMTHAKLALHGVHSTELATV